MGMGGGTPRGLRPPGPPLVACGREGKGGIDFLNRDESTICLAFGVSGPHTPWQFYSRRRVFN